MNEIERKITWNTSEIKSLFDILWILCRTSWQRFYCSANYIYILCLQCLSELKFCVRFLPMACCT